MEQPEHKGFEDAEIVDSMEPWLDREGGILGLLQDPDECEELAGNFIRQEPLALGSSWGVGGAAETSKPIERQAEQRAAATRQECASSTVGTTGHTHPARSDSHDHGHDDGKSRLPARRRLRQLDLEAQRRSAQQHRCQTNSAGSTVSNSLIIELSELCYEAWFQRMEEIKRAAIQQQQAAAEAETGNEHRKHSSRAFQRTKDDVAAEFAQHCTFQPCTNARRHGRGWRDLWNRIMEDDEF